MEARTYANGHLPSMYGDLTNGSESREMQLFIDRVGGDPDHLDTKGGSPESKPLTTKLNGSSNHVKSNIKTNGSLIHGCTKQQQNKPNSKNGGKSSAVSKSKANQNSEGWQSDDPI